MPTSFDTVVNLDVLSKNVEECLIVLDIDTDAQRQKNEDQFHQWLSELGYPMPAFSTLSYRLDWLALRRLHFYMAKAVANQHWEAYRYFKHAITP